MVKKDEKDTKDTKDWRLEWLKETASMDNIKDYMSDDKNSETYLAIMFAYLLDTKPDFIKLVTKYRRSYTDRLLVDYRLL